jgi:hypothetical protein
MAIHSRESAAASADVYDALDVLAAQLAAGLVISPVAPAEQQEFSAFYHS